MIWLTLISCWRGKAGEEYEGISGIDSPEAALALLPDCETTSGDGSIDLDAECVGAGCVGMNRIELEAGLGASSCEVYADDGWECAFRDGDITAFWFDSMTEDDIDDLPSDFIRIFSTYEGGTSDGLQIGASLNCVLDVLGEPDDYDFIENRGEYRLSALNYWGSPGVSFDDREDWTDDLRGYDGYIEEITLW